MPRGEGQGEREKRMSWVRSGQDGTGLHRLEKQLGLYFQCSRKAGRAAGSGVTRPDSGAGWMVGLVGWCISFEAPTIPRLQTDSSDVGPSTLRGNPCVIPS